MAILTDLGGTDERLHGLSLGLGLGYLCLLLSSGTALLYSFKTKFVDLPVSGKAGVGIT